MCLYKMLLLEKPFSETRGGYEWGSRPDSGRLGGGTQSAFGGVWVSLCWHCLEGPGVPNTLG